VSASRRLLSCVDSGIVVRAKMVLVSTVVVANPRAVRFGILPPLIVPIAGPSVDLGAVGFVAWDARRL